MCRASTGRMSASTSTAIRTQQAVELGENGRDRDGRVVGALGHGAAAYVRSTNPLFAVGISSLATAEMATAADRHIRHANRRLPRLGSTASNTYSRRKLAHWIGTCHR